MRASFQLQERNNQLQSGYLQLRRVESQGKNGRGRSDAVIHRGGTASSVDPDAGNTFTYTLVAGTGSGDKASFTITPTGVLKTAFSFNFKVKNSYGIRLLTTVQRTLSFEKQFTITVNNRNETESIVGQTNVNLWVVKSNGNRAINTTQ